MAGAYEFQDDDVIAPEVYGRTGHPHEAFAWLRENDPLRWIERRSSAPSGRSPSTPTSSRSRRIRRCSPVSRGRF